MRVRSNVPIEEQPLIWAALVQVSLTYFSSAEPAKKKRPQARYEPGDGNAIWGYVLEVRKKYNPKNGEDFQKVKTRVLQLAMNRGLPVEKRNFYSSVIATYFSWKFHEKRSNDLLDLLAVLPPAPHSIFKGAPNATSVQS